LLIMCQEAGFAEVRDEAETQEILQGDAYFDPEGPLKREWRTGDSTWALATETELASAQESVNNKDDIELRIATAEERRQTIGQSTFIVARK